MGWRRLGIFASGVLFGTAGVKILSGRDAKKAYTHVAAAVLRGKDCVMENYDKVRENCSDIIADGRVMSESVTCAEDDRRVMSESVTCAEDDRRVMSVSVTCGEETERRL